MRTLLCWEGQFTPADKAASDYVLLPFEVPPGVARLEVRYVFEGQGRPDSPNVIDMGLFDPRGADFLRAEGFRGWSGSARSEAILTPRSATPGYLPGPLFPGRWYVILGLYRIAPQGCACRVIVEAAEEEGELPHPPPPHLGGWISPAASASAEEAGWLRGDLQSHSHHSDAPGSLEDLIESARRRGLDFLAVTEHNTVSHLPYLQAWSRPDLLLIPGEEVTTYYGHMNAWGISRWLDFRCRTAEQLRAVIEAAHAMGALVSINHPKTDGPPWEYPPDLPVDAVEAWQGPWPLRNQESLAFWDRLLRAGRRVTAVGGSDKHQDRPSEGTPFYQVGHPTTWVYAAARTIPAILDAIRLGRVVITADVDAPWLELTAEQGDRRWMVGDEAPPGPLRIRCVVREGKGLHLRLLSRLGEQAFLAIDRSPFEWTTELDLRPHGYVRAELRGVRHFEAETPDDLPMVAMTNPIWGPVGWFEEER
ncbi:CehA/McbA family metallohydrolase [Thermoflexus sp.]|uniref:CehA/McbA family metallohydrolase n=1 Tax=Thermoflexus sp. TaxID=1969742 RepID=UPI0035E41F24